MKLIWNARGHYLVTVLRPTDSQSGAVRTPSEVGNTVAMALKRFVEFEQQGVGIEVPDDDGVVLGAGGKLEAVRREPAVPDFFAVIRQNLKKNQLIIKTINWHREWCYEFSSNDCNSNYYALEG